MDDPVAARDRKRFHSANGGSDLRQRGIARAGEVAAIGPPFDHLGGGLPGEPAARRGEQCAEQDENGGEETAR